MSLNATLANISESPAISRVLAIGRWLSQRLLRKQSLADRGCQQLGIERAAMGRGSAAQTTEATGDLAGVETDISQWCEEQLTPMQLKVRRLGDRVRRMQLKQDLKASIAEMQLSEPRAQAAINPLLAERKGALLMAREQGEQREQEYDQFRKSNGLDRDYREPRQRWLFVGAIALLALIVCTLACYWHWQQQLDVTAAAGIIVAIGMGFSLLPALIGYFGVREANHRSSGRFLAGIVATIGCIFALLVGAIAVALYLDPVNSQSLAEFLRAFYESPAVLGPLNWPLIATLVSAGGASMLAGYSLEDPYPGFSDHQRRKTAARRSFFRLSEQVHKDAASIAARQLSAVTRQYQKVVRRHNRYRGLMATYKKRYARYQEHADAVEQARSLMLERCSRQYLSGTASGDHPPYVSAPSHQSERGAALHQQLENLQIRDDELEKERQALDADYRETTQSLEYFAASLLNEVDYLPERVSVELHTERVSNPGPQRRVGRVHLASGR